MWFTKVSLKNPVFATMVMLAIVVLGLFSYQRLKVDQFPNIDFPVVVVTVDYPGASPEIVESEVTKKIEEGVNSIAGINALTSRSYEGTAVVIIEFQLHIDGRKAAEDVREKVATVRPLLRTEVKEPRVLRFDPASRAVWSLAVLPDEKSGRSAVELTTWAEQILKKRLENVRGVGAVNLVGATKREINIYLNPQALEAFGVTPDQVAQAVRNENQDLPVGSIRALAQERVVQIDARMERPEDFGKIIVARKNGAPVRLDQVARVNDGAQEVESLALHRDHRADAANCADRHVPVHEHVRLHHQHDHADGAEPVRGLVDRRCHRGAREHRAPRADGQRRLRSRHGRHAGDWPGGAGHHAVHRGGVHAHWLHGRHHRQVFPRVRHHHRGGGDDLDVCELHA